MEKLTKIGKEKVELAKALIRAADKAKNPPKAKAKAKAEAKAKSGDENK